MEVEWDVKVSDAGSERDFNKLLCFNAPLKVFVYYCKDRSCFKRSIEQRLRQFSGHREGDEYLIVEFCWRTGWLREKRLFRIQNGQVCELKFDGTPVIESCSDCGVEITGGSRTTRAAS